MAELNGWRSIAAYLGVSVRTAQRWERTLALPVQRQAVQGRADEVMASTERVDAWLALTATRRAQDISADSSQPPAVLEAEPQSRWGPRDRIWTATVAVAALVGLGLGRFLVPAVPTVQPIVPTGSPRSNIVGDEKGQLVGRIAVDLNGNGEWDAGEPFVAEPGRDCANTRLVAGLSVRWDGGGTGSSSPMNCNPEPFYHARLAAGRYRAWLEPPEGWRITSAGMVQVDIERGRDTHLWFAIAPISNSRPRVRAFRDEGAR